MVQITMDRAPNQFRDWLGRNGEFEEDDGVPEDGPVRVMVPLERANELGDAMKARDLLRTATPRDQIELEIRIEMQLVGRGCEREWVCEDGTWSPTGKTRLTERQFVSEGTDYFVRKTCHGGNQVVTAFSSALNEIARRQEVAWKAEQALRERCAG